MQNVVGIFTSRAEAEQAADRICSLGIPREHVNFLTPGASSGQLAQVPTTETEQPGVAPVLGGVVGGAVGASGGLMAATVLTALIPGIGPIAAIGMAAMGALGLVGGALAGGALENAMSDGLPKDEIFVYEDALRQGRTVLIVLTEDTTQAEAVRTALTDAGAESLDAARDQWWVGLRDAEAEAYITGGGDFAGDEALFRRGFTAALHPQVAGKPYAESMGHLQAHHADEYEQTAFRRGYERGQAYHRERRGAGEARREGGEEKRTGEQTPGRTNVAMYDRRG